MITVAKYLFFSFLVYPYTGIVVFAIVFAAFMLGMAVRVHRSAKADKNAGYLRYINYLLFIGLPVVIYLLAISKVVQEISKRNTINSSSAFAPGIVKWVTYDSIRGKKIGCLLEYQFVVNHTKYTGTEKSLVLYHAGDAVTVKYYTQKPSLSTLTK